MDAAQAADMSWADRNYQFRRPWSPPEKRNPALGGSRKGADFVINRHPSSNRNDQAAQLDREADALLFLGRHAAAERLAHQADAMRQAVPA